MSYLRQIFLWFNVACCVQVQAHKLPINKVVLWGHKLNSHTHSYIHYGFVKAFKHLGYDTYWLDNNDDISDIDFTNTLFITEGQVDQNIPLRNDCYYVLHFCNRSRYLKKIDKNRVVSLFAYLKPCEKFNNNQKMTECVFYNLVDQVIHMPWATDLLPDEIDQNKRNINLDRSDCSSIYIGSCAGQDVYGNSPEINLFKKACNDIDHEFNYSGGYTGGTGFIDNDIGINLIKKAYIAPAIQGKWQADFGYIPCRIFKNISYGKLGITNNKTVYELFNKKIVYNPDSYQLCLDAYNRMLTINELEIIEQMDFVKDHHTYLNRIDQLLRFIEMVFR